MENISALEYHYGTNHPGGNLFDPGHRYDPSNRPPRVKSYPNAAFIELPEVEPNEAANALAAIQRRVSRPVPLPLDRKSIARMLHFSAGVTTWLNRPPLGKIPFRAASCTGALYHIEIYLAWAGSKDLAAGLYYYQPEEHGLARLREGNPSTRLKEIAPPFEDAGFASALIFTSDYWRNASKYQARAYRHAFWDSGTILANSLALFEAFGWDHRLILGFVDDQVERLLGIGDRPEVPLFLLTIGADAEPNDEAELGELSATAKAIGGFRTDWPAIQAVHRATCLGDRAEVIKWTAADDLAQSAPSPDGPRIQLALEEGSAPEVGSIEAVINQRGSSRQFKEKKIAKAQLARLLKSVNGSVKTEPADQALNHLFLNINAVKGIEPGAYYFQPESDQLVLLSSGEFRDEAQMLALDQRLGGAAAVNLYWLTNLREVVDSLGERGYRVVQLQAAEAAGRGYLGAYALGLGATGLTFYDQAVVDFFSPASRDMAVMFLLAVGVPA